jgi:hypothetical protein
MNNSLLSLFFFITTISGIAQDISYVNAENGLIVREKPDTKSKKIGKLSYGTPVKIIKKTNIYLDIKDDGKNISGEWFLIEEIDGAQNGYVFSGFLVKDGIFSLIEPNVSQLKELHKSDQKTEVIYHYLSSNYKKSGKKYNVKHYDWNESEICSFSEDFKPGITFELFECKEAGGATIKVKLPKVNRKNLMKWIEKIYEVNKMGVDQNVWKDNNSKFEPKEAAAGCYYKIKETKNNTIVDLYCGC